MKLKSLMALAIALLCSAGAWADDVFKVVSDKITNPSFEDGKAVVADQQNKDPLTTGWKYTQSNGRAAIYNSESTTNMTYGASSASAGSYFLRIRSAGSDNATGTSTVTQKSAFSLNKGAYRISFDYKAAQPGSDDRTFTVFAKNGSAELGKKTNAIPKSISANLSYFSTGGGKDWTTDNFSFSLASTTSVTLEIQCQTKKYSGGHTTLLLDNFILEWNLTQSLQDLIDEANTFLTDEGDSEGTSYTALKSAIDAADAVKGSSDADELEAQYNALTAALALAKDHRKPWLAAKTNAETAIANTTDYGNVVGEEKTNLQSAIDADEPSDASSYDTAKSNLETKTNTFTGAKASYDAFVTAKTAETPDLAYATSAKKSAVTDAKGASDATSASDADAKTAAIATALRAYYESHAAAEKVATASDFTSRITDAEDPSNTNAWTKTNSSGNINLRIMSDQSYTDADGTNNQKYFDSNSWDNSFTSTVSQNLTLPAGSYLLTVKARGNEVTTYKVIANYEEITNETAIPSTGNTGGVYGNGWNDYSVEFTIGESKTVTIGIYVESGSNHKWVSFGDFRLVKLDATYADEDDYDALADAISTVEGALGFDAGEYAPYNVASTLATAKAFNPEVDNIQSEVQDATAALLALTTNVSEVDAVYNGCFDDSFTGWTRSSDWGTCISVSGDYSTAYRNYAGYIKYGDTGYYTMPLKANTYYKLKTAYRSQQSISYTLRVTASVKNGEEGLASTDWPWTNSTSQWSKPSEIFKTGSAGNYVLKLQNTADTQITGVSLRRATAEELKTILETELSEANELYNSGANLGEGIFQIPRDAGTTFNSVITTAQGVYDNASATADEVATAISNLQDAKTIYANVALNAPDSEKRYSLTIHWDGKAFDGYNVTFNHNARVDEGLYGIKYIASDVNRGQAFKFTPVSGNKYKVSFLTPVGTEQYITTNNLAYGSNKSQIRTTDEESKALEIEIKLTSTENQFQLYNTDANAVIASSGNDDMYTQNSANFSISEATQANVTVSCKAGKYGTVIFPFKPDVSTGFDDITFYSISELTDGTLTLAEVADPVANTPYILKNDDSNDFSKTLQGFGTAKQNEYTDAEELLTGFYTAIEIPAGNYVLQTQGGVQAFYKLTEAAIANQVYRAYLTAPAAVKAFYFDFNDATAIAKIQDSGSKIQDSEIFNLAGQKMSKLQKGVNIVNGKKVLVK